MIPIDVYRYLTLYHRIHLDVNVDQLLQGVVTEIIQGYQIKEYDYRDRLVTVGFLKKLIPWGIQNKRLGLVLWELVETNPYYIDHTTTNWNVIDELLDLCCASLQQGWVSSMVELGPKLDMVNIEHLRHRVDLLDRLSVKLTSAAFTSRVVNASQISYLTPKQMLGYRRRPCPGKMWSWIRWGKKDGSAFKCDTQTSRYENDSVVLYFKRPPNHITGCRPTQAFGAGISSPSR